MEFGRPHSNEYLEPFLKNSFRSLRDTKTKSMFPSFSVYENTVKGQFPRHNPNEDIRISSIRNFITITPV